MEIHNHLKSSDPIVMRLKSEHALLSTEINQLNRELLALKETIRYKQKDLRIINSALIHKATRGPFLSVAQSIHFPHKNNHPSKQSKTHAQKHWFAIKEEGCYASKIHHHQDQ